MNQPDRYSRFVLAEGLQKVTYTQDTKIPSAGTFIWLQEDHTMGNLVRCQLHADKHVVFAGYRIPHPLESRMEVRVQTVPNTKTPVQAVEHALEDLRSETQQLINQFEHQVNTFPRNMNMQ